jgi:hypothetical protein
MVEFVQGVGMVYFHFPFSTHAPVPIPKLSCFSELNLQELARRAAGSRGSYIKVCRKIIWKKNLTFIPSYLICKVSETYEEEAR